MPKIRMPKQYKGYLSEWDTFGYDPTMGLAPAAGISLLKFAKQLKKAKFPKVAIQDILETFRIKPGIKGTKELLSEVTEIVPYTKKHRITSTGFADPERYRGYHAGTKIGLREYGLKSWDTVTQAKRTVRHELLHEAHMKLIRRMLRKQHPDWPEDMISYIASKKVKLKKGQMTGESIAYAGAADWVGELRDPLELTETLLSSPLTHSGKHITTARKLQIDSLRAKQILKKATKPSGFLSGRIKSRLLLPHLKP